jgi:hypothetical protein
MISKLCNDQLDCFDTPTPTLTVCTNDSAGFAATNPQLRDASSPRVYHHQPSTHLPNTYWTPAMSQQTRQRKHTKSAIDSEDDSPPRASQHARRPTAKLLQSHTVRTTYYCEQVSLEYMVTETTRS